MSDSERPETGVMQFGDDWPGVFIRGDNAFAFALMLKPLLDELSNSLSKDQLNVLINLLESSNVNVNSSVQLVKDFSQCKYEKTQTDTFSDEIRAGKSTSG